MTPDKALHWRDLPPPVLALLRQGSVIPAHPLALGPDRKFDRQSQRAISRYYVDAGSGGLAVGVHSTQFAIRDVGLYRPVLELAIETAREWTDRPLVMIAGAVGKTVQAVEEARTARSLGYHAVLLSLAAMKEGFVDLSYGARKPSGGETGERERPGLVGDDRAMDLEVGVRERHAGAAKREGWFRCARDHAAHHRGARLKEPGSSHVAPSRSIWSAAGTATTSRWPRSSSAR